jgi:hypothetical protein
MAISAASSTMFRMLLLADDAQANRAESNLSVVRAENKSRERSSLALISNQARDWQIWVHQVPMTGRVRRPIRDRVPSASVEMDEGFKRNLKIIDAPIGRAHTA